MKQMTRAALTLTLLLITSLPQLAHAQRSRVENGHLIVPRVDVFGYGSFELDFRIDHDGDYLFVLDQANETSLDTDVAGLFDPIQIMVDINEIELDTGALYYLQLKFESQTVSPDIHFRVTAVELLNPEEIQGGSESEGDQGSGAGDEKDGASGDDDASRADDSNDTDDPSNSSGEDNLSAAREVFDAMIAEPIVQNRCVVCHVLNGPSGNTPLVFTAARDDADHLDNNFEVFRNYLLSQQDDGSRILSKVSGNEHGGGAQLPATSSAYAELAAFLTLLNGSPSDTVVADQDSDTTESGQDGPLMTLAKSVYAVNEAIVVEYDGLPGNGTDWIGSFVAGSGNTSYLQYEYSNGRTRGTMSFDGLAAGDYALRLFYNDSYQMEAEVTFTVAAGQNDNAGNDDDSAAGTSQNEVVFVIPDGTDEGDWNSEDNPLVVEQGQTLVVIDGDSSRRHWLHTAGADVCAHPDGFIPEGGQICKIDENATPGLRFGDSFRDHITYGNFYVMIVEATTETTQTTSQDLECSFDWDTFTKASDLACFESREELLQNIPDRVRPNWMMMHGSRSNQFASMENPRVILLAPTGKFILSVETLEDSDSVEVAVFDYEENSWDFAGLSFQGDAPAQVEREVCKVCHTDNVRPIWTGYASWPGTVGDRDDIQAEELELLNRAKADGLHPVYKHLVFRNSYPLNGVLRPRVSYGENGNNQLLNFMVAKNAGMTLAAEVMGNEELALQDRLHIAYELACRENYSSIRQTLSQYGYDYHDFFGFHKMGDNRQRMWIGFNHIDFPAGILLLDALSKDQPQLQELMPELTLTLQDSRLEVLFNLELDQHPGWSSYDFGFQRDFYNATQAEELSCSTLQGMIE